jgi:hypothetical protein
MKLNTANSRVWLFRGLVAVAAGLMIASFAMPWWSIDDFTFQVPATLPLQTVRIYAYGLRHSLGPGYLTEDKTPLYQTVLAWVYLGASVGLMFLSTWLKGRKSSWVLGGIGLVYIGYAAMAGFVVIASRLAFFGLPLQGWGGIPETVTIHGALRLGYYLAYAAGGMCIALALLRNIITGRPKSGNPSKV